MAKTVTITVEAMDDGNENTSERAAFVVLNAMQRLGMKIPVDDEIMAHLEGKYDSDDTLSDCEVKLTVVKIYPPAEARFITATEFENLGSSDAGIVGDINTTDGLTTQEYKEHYQPDYDRRPADAKDWGLHEGDADEFEKHIVPLDTSENGPVWKVIERAASQTCDIRAVIAALQAHGYLVRSQYDGPVPIPTEEIPGVVEETTNENAEDFETMMARLKVAIAAACCAHDRVHILKNPLERLEFFGTLKEKQKATYLKDAELYFMPAISSVLMDAVLTGPDSLAIEPTPWNKAARAPYSSIVGSSIILYDRTDQSVLAQLAVHNYKHGRNRDSMIAFSNVVASALNIVAEASTTGEGHV